MKSIFAVLLLSVCAHATTISQKLVLGNLTPWNGTVTLSLYTAGEAAGQYVIAAEFQIHVSVGNLRTVLAPGNYQVSYSPALATALPYWIVPTSGTYTVSQVESADLPAPLVPLTQLAQGGASNNQLLIWNGMVWAPSFVSLSEILASGGVSGNTVVYSGGAWVPLNVVFGETPTFTSGTSFTLAHTPEGAVACFRNGLRQANPGDYTITALTISSAYWATDGSDTLLCDYTY